MYQWYKGSGIAILGATNNTYVATITNIDSFYCKVTCTYSGLSANSTQIIIQINLPSNGSSAITACDSYIWNSNCYTLSGTYTSTFTNAAGSDSVRTLNLTIHQSTTSTISLTGCESVNYNGNTYTQTLLNPANCDSLVSIQVDITTVVASISTNGTSFSTSNLGTYQWINCATNSPAANSTFTPVTGGMYAVVITYKGCIDTSNCLMSSTGIENIILYNHHLYPNPTSGVFEFIVQTNCVVTLANDIGEIVFQQSFKKGKHIIDLTKKASGIYLMKLDSGSKVETYKVMKE